MGRTPVDLPDPVTWILSGVLSLHGASMEQALVDGSLTGEFAAWGVQYTAGLLLVPVAVCVLVGLVGVAQNLARKKREQPHEQPFIQDVAAANVEPLQAVYDEAAEVSDGSVAEPMLIAEESSCETATADSDENAPAVEAATVNAVDLAKSEVEAAKARYDTKASAVEAARDDFHDKYQAAWKAKRNLDYAERVRYAKENYLCDAWDALNAANGKVDDMKDLRAAYVEAKEALDRAAEAYTEAKEVFDRAAEAYTKADKSLKEAKSDATWAWRALDRARKWAELTPSEREAEERRRKAEERRRRAGIGSKWAADEAYSQWFRSTLNAEDRKKYDAQVAREKEVIKAKEKLKQIQFKKEIDASLNHGLETGEMGIFKW